VSSVAARFGVKWDAIWEHPENADLRSSRGDPNVLSPGDVLVIPQAERREVTAETGRAHRFVVALPSSRVRVRLLGGGEPRRTKPYTLVLEDGTEREGTTDGDGYLDEKVPAASRSVTVRFDAPGLGTATYVLRLGHLDPVTEVGGVQQRLRNLGFHCDVTGEIDDATGAALTLFQEAQGLEPSGSLDPRTRDALRQAHGS
jgi:hypothetical protein